MTGRVLRVLFWILTLYFVARAVVELVTVDPGDPSSYRTDWGGPHYLGVVAVHVLPGLVLLVVGLIWVRRRRRARLSRPDQVRG